MKKLYFKCERRVKIVSIKVIAIEKRVELRFRERAAWLEWSGQEYLQRLTWARDVAGALAARQLQLVK